MTINEYYNLVVESNIDWEFGKELFFMFSVHAHGHVIKTLVCEDKQHKIKWMHYAIDDNVYKRKTKFIEALEKI